MNRKSLTLAIYSMAFVGCGNCSSTLSSTVESISSQESVKVSSIVGDWSGVLNLITEWVLERTVQDKENIDD